MSEIREKILRALQEASGEKDIVLEQPENENFGDYSSSIAMTMFAKSQVPSYKNQTKFKFQNPRELAEELINKLKVEKSLSEICDKVEIAGPGFINFWLKTDTLIDTLKQIDISKSDFGKSEIGKGKTVIVDYSSPNIAKPFGIGHLRSTIIGQALYNLYKYLGYEVVGDNHLGDWGTQFGKLIYMIEEEKPDTLSIETLEALYVKFHKLAEEDPTLEEKARGWFKKLEKGDDEAKKIWRECVDVSLAEFDRIYDMIGVSIDFAFGESYYESEMKQMLGDPKMQRYLIEGEGGAKVVDLEGFGIKTPLMILKSDGATTYATRDLAAIKFRVRKWDPSLIIYEVGAEQTLHFQQVFAAAKLLGLVKPETRLYHTAHGLYLAPDGKKFSTRKGKTIKLEEVLNEAIERARQIIAGRHEREWLDTEVVSRRKINKGPILGVADEINVSRQVGIGAIKYFDLMHAVGSNVVFDWDKMMNLEGNSGPYLQYTVARCNSLLKKGPIRQDVVLHGVYSNLAEEELLVLRVLVHFPEVVEESAENFAPNLLCNYLYDLAQKYNHLYNSLKIIGSEAENFRLALTFGVSQVLKNGLGILGIQTPSKM